MTRRRKREQRGGSERESFELCGAEAPEGERDGRRLLGWSDDLAHDGLSVEPGREARGKLYYDEWT